MNSHAIAPNLYKKLSYDPQRDFAMVAYVGYVPNVLVMHPSIPAKNVGELVTIAKAKLEEVGTQLNPMSPEQFATFLGSEIAKYARLIKTANVSID